MRHVETRDTCAHSSSSSQLVQEALRPFDMHVSHICFCQMLPAISQGHQTKPPCAPLQLAPSHARPIADLSLTFNTGQGSSSVAVTGCQSSGQPPALNSPPHVICPHLVIWQLLGVHPHWSHLLRFTGLASEVRNTVHCTAPAPAPAPAEAMAAGSETSTAGSTRKHQRC
jgi:hypothetical protein